MSDATVNVEASRLMDHPRIALRIKELTAPVVAKIQMTRAEWFSLIEKSVRYDVRKMFNQFGNPKEIVELDDPEAMAIADYEFFEVFRGKGDNRTVVGVTKKFKFIDRLKALEILGKAKGFYRDGPDEGLDSKVPARVEVVFVDAPGGNVQVNMDKPAPKLNFVGPRADRNPEDYGGS
jgi:phage terminase small subunit